MSIVGSKSTSYDPYSSLYDLVNEILKLSNLRWELGWDKYILIKDLVQDNQFIFELESRESPPNWVLSCHSESLLGLDNYRSLRDATTKGHDSYRSPRDTTTKRYDSYNSPKDATTSLKDATVIEVKAVQLSKD